MDVAVGTALRAFVLLRHNTSTVSSDIDSTTGTSRKVFRQRPDQSNAYCCDRVWDVALRPQGRIRAVDNFRVAQVSRMRRLNEVPRGESSLARRPGIRKPRCRVLRDD